MIRWKLILTAGCVTLFLASSAGIWSHLYAQPDTKGPAKTAGKAKVDNSPKGDEDAKEEEAEKDTATENPFPKRFPAPNLDGGKAWLNTANELSLKDLRGKVVLLDFWTYCCINCMHVIPDLKYLEKKYPNELVVIGVHSAKFDNEKDSENIRGAILRYEIEHPVVNDAQMTIWRKYQVHSWPTMVLIDPEGNYCGYVPGEGNREVLDAVIQRLITYHKSKGTLSEKPINFELESKKSAPTPLRFPGKILADEAGQRLFISDSNHNRIVISDLNGKVIDVVGTGAIGARNGAYGVAEFDHPQGMDLDGNTLYVADTENHLLRAIDLESKVVRTVAGTGVQALGRLPGGKPLETPLASPWDVKMVSGKLYIAMAGPHQIWVMEGTENIRPFAGSGREDILNGPHSEAALAQPSGITTDGKSLFVVDSEGSAVRQIPLDTNGEVTTIVGTSDLAQGRCLFEFGDIDGVGDEVRLQHPLGITYRDGQLYVADSYNHKVKVVDISKHSAKTFIGTGKAGTENSPPQLSEPAGLTFLGNKLLIADTNNHRIQVYDLASKKISTMTLEGLQPPNPPVSTEEAPSTPGAPKVTELKPQTIATGDGVEFEVALNIPEGFKFNSEAPCTYRIKADGDQSLIAKDNLDTRVEVTPKNDKLVFKVPLAAKTGDGKFRLTISYGFCKNGPKGLCKIKTVSWMIPVKIVETSEQKSVSLSVE